MARMSTLSNPTGLKDLDKKVVSLILDDKGVSSSYSLSQLDLSTVSLPKDAHVIVIARRGNAELRTDHGLIEKWDKGFIDVTELGGDGAWVFRVLFVAPNSPKLLAVVENVRPNGLGNSESLIGMELADLGPVPWDLQILEQEGRAVILLNRDIYSTVGRAADDAHFWTLVLPEAVRRLASVHAASPGKMEEQQWESFKKWLALLGIDEEPDEDSHDDERDAWCKSVVRAFCERYQAAEMLRAIVNKSKELE